MFLQPFSSVNLGASAAMSATYVDCDTLPGEWDNNDILRDRIRKEGILLTASGGNDVKIPRCAANSDVLIPILAQIGAGCRLAEIDGLREAVENFYSKHQKTCQEDDISKTAWDIREMVFFVKRKTQRKEVSRVHGLWN